MADKRFVERYEEKEKKCKKWKNFIDIKKSIVFCSVLGGILGALVGIPAGGAVCGGVMGTNAQDSLQSLVDWFVGPSEDDKKKYEFYKKYEDKYLSYVKECARENKRNVNFDKSPGLLLGIQQEIETCYNSYCNLNEDETDIDMDEIINKNIKKQHQELKNLPDRNWRSSISDVCQDIIKNVGNFFFKTGKGESVKSLKQIVTNKQVVKSLEEIVPDKHISTDMDPDKQCMYDLYKKIIHNQEITINFVDQCSPEQNNENRNTKSNTLYLSRDMFKKVYKVFTNTKFEKEKNPTEDNRKLFCETDKLLCGDLLNKSFMKDFIKNNFSLEKDHFHLNAMPPMKWKVKKKMVNGEPSAAKTLEYFFADISKYIQRNKYQGLKGSIEPSMKNNDAITLSAKYSNLINKKFHNLSSSVNKKISEGSDMEKNS